MISPLFKGIKLALFIECPDCHALSKHGTPECKFCNTKLSSTEDLNVHILAVNLGASYTPFVECPNCRKLVKVGIRRCRDCYEEVPEEYAFSSAVTVVFNTVACDVANSMAALDTSTNHRARNLVGLASTARLIAPALSKNGFAANDEAEDHPALL